MQMLFSFFLISLSHTEDSQNSDDGAQDILDALIKQMKSPPEDEQKHEDRPERPLPINHNGRPAFLGKRMLLKETQKPLREEHDADRENEEIESAEKKNDNAEFSLSTDDDQGFFGGFATGGFGGEDTEEDDVIGHMSPPSAPEENAYMQPAGDREDDDEDKRIRGEEMKLVYDKVLDDKNAPEKNAAKGEDKYWRGDGVNFGEEGKEGKATITTTDVTTREPEVAEQKVEPDYTSAATTIDTTTMPMAHGLTEKKQFETILHSPDPPHEKIHRLLEWMDRQDKEALDSLWPEIENALEESMRKNDRNEWGKLGVWADEDGQKGNDEGEEESAEDAAAGEEFYDLGSLHRNHVWALIGCLSGLCVSLGIYAFFATRNRNREAGGAPLIGNQDGYNNTLEHP